MNATYEHKTDPISIQRQSLRLGELPHLHKEMEIIYVEKGRAVAFADQVSYRIEEGDFFVSFPNQIHYYLDSQLGAYDVLIVNCNIFFGIKELLNNHIPENNVLHLKKDDPIAELVRQIVALPPDGDISAYVGYFNLMISQMLPQLKLKGIAQSDNSTLQSILEFCTKHYSEDISLEYVAEGLHLSRCYISHLFNRKISLGFNDYINMLRVQDACAQLLETDKKIADISEEVGFGSIRSFNRAFKNITSQTPLEYRANAKTSPTSRSGHCDAGLFFIYS